MSTANNKGHRSAGRTKSASSSHSVSSHNKKKPDDASTRGGGSGGGRRSAAAAAHKRSDRNKVGSSPEAARRFAQKNDFGIPADEAESGQFHGRAKGPEQGTGPTRSGMQGKRIDGVGYPTGPSGTGSGGDIDPDIIGIGHTGNLASTGPDKRTQGPDMTTEGGSAPFASGEEADGKNQIPPRHAGGRKAIKGTTITGAPSGSEGASSIRPGIEARTRQKTKGKGKK